MNPLFPDDNFEDAFLPGEAAAEQFERTFATQIQDIIKVAVVLHTVSGPLQHHIQLTAGEAQAYTRVADMILDYHRSRTHFERSLHFTEQPSESSGCLLYTSDAADE